MTTKSPTQINNPETTQIPPLAEVTAEVKIFKRFNIAATCWTRGHLSILRTT